MSVNQILFPVLLMGGMALVFGFLLMVVSKIFAVEADPRETAIREVLPGANCGACGFPGCDACAAAILKGEAQPDACPVAGPDGAAKIRGILGVAEPAPAAAPVAPAAPAAAPKADDDNEKTVAPAKKGPRTAEIDPEKCIGCTMCKKSCKFDAITGEVKQKHVIDKEKCKGCGLCASKCPKQAITVKNADGTPVAAPAPAPKPAAEAPKAPAGEKQVAVIDQEQCVGCTMCKRNCQFGAVSGEVKQKHSVDAAKCTGCGACAAKCPKKCITLQKA